MKKIIITFFVLAILFGIQTGAHAHSTKGRIKILLEKKTVTVDDMAYFIESYVHRQKYKGKYEKSKNRFYVKDFIKVEQKDGTAEVFFTVLDVKKSRTFEDFMSFVRNTDGIWGYVNESGAEVAKVYTYVKKTSYYYKKYVLPVSCTGLVLAGGGFIFIRMRRKRSK